MEQLTESRSIERLFCHADAIDITFSGVYNKSNVRCEFAFALRGWGLLIL